MHLLISASPLEEVVEYKIPDGSEYHLNSFTSPINFQDKCYDGNRDPRGGVLHNGVGCLTDSRVSTSVKASQLSLWHQNSENSMSTPGSPPIDCLVGWNRSQWEEARRSPSPAVDLVYRFSGLRVFDALHLYALDVPSRNVRLFVQEFFCIREKKPLPDANMKGREREREKTDQVYSSQIQTTSLSHANK